MDNTNKSVGFEKIKKKIKGKLKVYSFLFFTFVLVSLFLFALIGYLNTSKTEASAATASVIASFSNDESEVPYLLDNGEKQFSYAKDIRNSKWIESRKSSFYSALGWAFVFSIAISFFVVFIVYSYIVKYSKAEHLRGGKKGKTKNIKKTDEMSDYSAGEVLLLKKAVATGMVLFGDSGSGKSTLLMGLADAFYASNSRGIFYDRSGDFVKKFYREGYDIILNPFDLRHTVWSIYREIKSDYDFETLAKSFVPSSDAGKQNSNIAHWETEPRQFLADVMRNLFNAKDFEHKSIIEKIDCKDLATLEAFLEGTASQQSVAADNEKHARSILSSLGSKMNGLRFCHSESNVGFSIKEWVRDNSDKRNIFINVNKNQYEVIKSLVSFWIDLAINEILSQEKTEEEIERETWIFLDEAQSLEKIDSLKQGYEELRKFKGRIITSVTSLPAFETVYGETTARSIISTAGVKCIFTNSDPKAATYLSDLLTKQEEKRYNENIYNNGGANLNEQQLESALFTPSEIQSLKDFEVVVKQKGKPVLKTTLKRVDRKSIAVGNIESKNNKDLTYQHLPAEEFAEGRSDKQPEVEKKPPAPSKPKVVVEQKSKEKKPPPQRELL